MKIKKWTVTGATIALLTAAGYKVGEFNEKKGYAVIDTLYVKDTVVTELKDTIKIHDTLWFKDSLKLHKFARFGVARFGRGKFVNQKDSLND